MKKPHINTHTYKKAITTGMPKAGTDVDYMLEGVNKYLMALAKEQIQLAFVQSEKEVADLRQRTKEGGLRRPAGRKTMGAVSGRTIATKKSVEAKKIIQRYSAEFGWLLNNQETMRLAGISKNT